jgi:putative aldouronate transport system permease protein
MAQPGSIHKIRTTPGDKLFTIFNYLFFILVGAVTVLPFLNLIAKSLSSEAAVVSGMVRFLPIDMQWKTYAFVIKDDMFLHAIRTPVLITVIGTLAAVVLTIITAYPLSKTRLRARKFFILIFIVTMLFSGGLVPTYLLMHNLHLINKMPVLILPGLLNVFNMLVIKNFFEALPDSLEESAQIDGARNTTILLRIVVPLSMPVFATIGLFYAVGYWNDYFNAMIYITTPELKPLQLFLMELLQSASDVFMRAGNGSINVDKAMNTSAQSIQAASIILATLPILFVYPFLQKYFVKGVMLGSVKG